jgi:hypothetical protein
MSSCLPATPTIRLDTVPYLFSKMELLFHERFKRFSSLVLGIGLASRTQLRWRIGVVDAATFAQWRVRQALSDGGLVGSAGLGFRQPCDGF